MQARNDAGHGIGSRLSTATAVDTRHAAVQRIPSLWHGRTGLFPANAPGAAVGVIGQAHRDDRGRDAAVRAAGTRIAGGRVAAPGSRDVGIRFASRADGKQTLQWFEIDALDDEPDPVFVRQ